MAPPAVNPQPQGQPVHVSAVQGQAPVPNQVDAVQVLASIPVDAAENLQGRVAPNPANPQLAQRMDALMQGRRQSSEAVRQQMRGQLNIFNTLGDGSSYALPFDPNGNELKADLVNYYLTAHDLILNEQGLGDQVDHITQFNIHFEKGIAQYINADGRRITVDLLTINDPEIKQFLEDYAKKMNIYSGYKDRMKVKFAEGFRGSMAAPRPFAQVQQSATLQSLPRTFDETASNVLASHFIDRTSQQQMRMTKRHIFTEVAAKRMTHELDSLITTKEQELQTYVQNNPNGDEKATREAEINALERLKERVENLDMYALSTAFGYYSGSSVSQARMLYEGLLTFPEFGATETPQKRNWKRLWMTKVPAQKTEAHLREDSLRRDYARDIAALVTQNRWDHYDFSRLANAQTKRDSLEDVFLKEALQFNRTQDAWDVNNHMVDEIVRIEGAENVRQDLERIVQKIGEDMNKVAQDVATFDAAPFNNVDDLEKAQAAANALRQHAKQHLDPQIFN